jgi:DNA-directed RNA polymerase, mitochondrial
LRRNLNKMGRVYPTSAYLHEQSSDNAKGILILDDGSPLGDNGFKWLCLHIANCYGEDKLPLVERVSFTQSRLDTFVSYADNPMVNRDWMTTDQPFSFLAGCNELRRIRDWVDLGNRVEDYVCGLPVFMDGLTMAHVKPREFSGHPPLRTILSQVKSGATTSKTCYKAYTTSHR